MLKRCTECSRLKPVDMYANEHDPWCEDCGSRKLCVDCKEVKPNEMFRVRPKNKDGLDKRCKDCQRAWEREYQRKRYVPKPRRKPKDTPKKVLTDKKCFSCLEVKPLHDFYKRKVSCDGYTTYCKTCLKARDKEYKKRNRHLVNSKEKRWRDSDPETYKEYRKSYYHQNKEKVLGYIAARRANKLNASPDWLSEEHLQEMKNIYSHAKECELLTGDSYHVDHIVPLQGKTVCGLHVPWNLQVLPAEVNLSKNNSYNDWEEYADSETGL